MTTLNPSVDELTRAARALLEGQFREDLRAGQRRCAQVPVESIEWLSGPHPVIPVVGAGGGAGASTVALALAEVIGGARVIDCANPSASGLVAAATAELGRDESGWVQARRDGVGLERVGALMGEPSEVPLPQPPAPGCLVTVVDVAWEAGAVMARRCWLADLLAQAPVVVVVTSATVPGMRRLEAVLDLLGHERVVAAVAGPPLRRWARGVRASAGRAGSALLDRGLWVQVPAVSALATRGVDSAPLPLQVRRSAQELSGICSVAGNQERQAR